MSKNEQGAVAIVVALLSAALIGFTALAVDVGYLYEVKRQVQAAADAGALAGAQTMVTDSDQTNITNDAEAYVKKNDFIPNTMGDPIKMANITITPDESVEVTASKRVPLFFAKIFNWTEAEIAAKAKAQIVFLTGGYGLVPWGAPIINADKVTAEIVGSGSGEIDLTKDEVTGDWEGNLPKPSTPSDSGYPIRIKAYNQQFTEDNPDGYPETIGNASYVIIKPDSQITDVYFDNHDNFIEDNGSTIKFYARSTGGAPDIRFNGKNSKMSSSGGDLYKVNLTIPSTELPYKVFPLKITSPESIDNAACLVVRRSSYPINQFTASAAVNPSGTVAVSVTVNDYKPGILYELKVTLGGETGNYMALDFSNIYHPPYTGASEGLNANSGAESYLEDLLGYEGEIHIGDIVWTKTGNLSWPQTKAKLEERFGPCLNETYEQWTAAGMPPGCGRIVYVPIVEKIDRQNGKSEVKVVSFGAFYIANKLDKNSADIRGYFVNYTGPPATYSTTPPSGNLVLKTVRLVAPE